MLACNQRSRLNRRTYRRSLDTAKIPIYVFIYSSLRLKKNEPRNRFFRIHEEERYKTKLVLFFHLPKWTDNYLRGRKNFPGHYLLNSIFSKIFHLSLNFQFFAWSSKTVRGATSGDCCGNPCSTHIHKSLSPLQMWACSFLQRCSEATRMRCYLEFCASI